MKVPKNSAAAKTLSNCFVFTVVVVFLVTMTIYTVQVTQVVADADEGALLRNSAGDPENEASETKQSGNQNETDGRRVRETAPQPGMANTNKTTYYYEEQRPVVVHSETLIPTAEPAYRARPFYPGPYYTPDVQEDYKVAAAAGAGGAAAAPSAAGAMGPNDYDNVGDDQSYDEDARFYGDRRPVPDYAVANNGRASSDMRTAASASNGMRPYDAYYRQIDAERGSASGLRKLQPTHAAGGTYPASGEPYEYDYPDFSAQYRRPMVSSQAASYESQQAPQRPTPSPTTQLVPQRNPAETFVSVLNTLQMMWKLYQSFTAAWNTVAEHRQQQEDLVKAKIQKNGRINSKRPPKFGAAQGKPSKFNATSIDNDGEMETSTRPKPSRKPSTMTTTKTTTPTTGSPLLEGMDEPRRNNKSKPAASMAKRPKGETQAAAEADGARSKRQSSSAGDEGETAVEEGRYIKGDPLKGYYDFVITEGSYKFWAVFQVGTALLIIYSTFAAIYYSKVNPLTSDYDYTDYLGGARSLGGGELDFVDDEVADGSGSSSGNSKSASWQWSNWMPRVGHSLKFILDAIDKLPASEDSQGYPGSDSGTTNGDADEPTISQ